MRARGVACRSLPFAAACLAAFVIVSPTFESSVAGASKQEAPQFHAGVDLLLIDVQVTPAKDAPMRALTAADFDVSVSGHPRPVVSVTFLHYDTGKVLRGRPPSAAPDTCVFGFYRRVDRVTAHYVVAVERSGTDQREVKQVKVKLTDKAFMVQQLVWRSPVHAKG